jgi:CubicO group peptidase (beta-lactamase class C family)
MGAYAPAGALRSTANDLLKYVSANLGLAQSDLTPLMEKMQVIRHSNSPGILPGETFGNTAMAWMDFGVYQPPGMQLLGHGGGAGGYSAFIGFDQKQRRGVVVLSNQRAALTNTYTIGWRILQRAPLKGMDLLTMRPMREHVGSGIALALDSQTRELRVTKVFENSPAARAGLTAGIIIRKINDVSVTGKSLTECLELMRGAADTSLRLELLNAERGDTMAIELKRQRFLISG